MPRHRLYFLLDQNTFYLAYGFDHACGYWAELWAADGRRPLTSYGALERGYKADEPFTGLLGWMVETGALDAKGLDEALAAWASPVPVRLSKRGRVALDVIETLKREAD